MTELTFNLEGALTIARAEALHAELEELEKKYHHVVLNALQVNRVDASILQLLVAFFRSMSARGQQVSWSGVSEDFAAAVALLGLTDVLKLN
jgi:anti-anti-sigma regulatory factor